jgi:molecular chaperone GrpE
LPAGPFPAIFRVRPHPGLHLIMSKKTAIHKPASSPGDAPLPPEASLVETPAPAPTPAELEALQAKAAKADEHWDRLLRTVADFENFKKRAARERQDAVQYANEKLLQILLPVLDNFEMAINAAGQATSDDAKAIQTGVTMILQQLKNALTEAGLEEVNAAGQIFDPNLHEALCQMESATVPEGHILQQQRRGYRLNGRLLRPASVILAKAPAAPAASAPA